MGRYRTICALSLGGDVYVYQQRIIAGGKPGVDHRLVPLMETLTDRNKKELAEEVL